MESEIWIYQTDDGQTKIEVRLDNENVWLTKQQMAILYQCDRSSVSKHIKNIYATNELEEKSTCANFAQVRDEGKRQIQRDVPFYNLDVIISVGYRVNGHRGTQFRIWATQRLKEYLIKGFTMDDERLKSGNQPNYFQELLDRIRDIRSSEKVFYQKVKDIYTTSIDYDSKSDLTQEFFATVQNKLHWATHNHTAPELVYKRANADKVNMGLTTWKSDKIRKADVTIAKNYLTETELKQLNLLVEQYLAFAEAQALSQKPMYMADWIKKLNDILTINEKEILLDAGRISAKMAKELAEREFEKFTVKQRQIEATENLKQLENDINNLKRKNKN